jgi:hypothetical protein
MFTDVSTFLFQSKCSRARIGAWCFFQSHTPCVYFVTGHQPIRNRHKCDVFVAVEVNEEVVTHHLTDSTVPPDSVPRPPNAQQFVDFTDNQWLMKRVLHGIWSEGMVNRRLMRIGMAPRVCFLSQLTSDGKGPVMAINDGDTEINDGDTEMARVLRSTDEEWHAHIATQGLDWDTEEANLRLFYEVPPTEVTEKALFGASLDDIAATNPGFRHFRRACEKMQGFDGQGIPAAAGRQPHGNCASRAKLFSQLRRARR